MDAADWLPALLGTATVLPLVSFFLILALGPRMGPGGRCAGYLATAAAGLAMLLSFVALLGCWVPQCREGDDTRAAAACGDHAARDTAASRAGGSAEGVPRHYTGEFRVAGLGTPWVLGQFGTLRLSVSYYIDSLTVCMFCMVSLVATLIHFYSTGYMREELGEVTDHEVTAGRGEPLRRPGRYPRFFQYLSLFSFSMMGLVLAGNVALVFVFWELVGICSYFLIGFYFERGAASTAGNKAFLVNRVGDFGMVVGMMALWASLGTFSFGDVAYVDRDGNRRTQPGIFRLVRSGHGVRPAEGMRRFAARREIAREARTLAADVSLEVMRTSIGGTGRPWRQGPGGAGERLGYGLLMLAGLGIFAGCVGKSAQFPLHVWLPDAMEGPTPVSALLHSATMVAAGVYLVGRFYPALAPEVLLVIAAVGCLTLFMAATIAITATDIKRVLAYSTVSQLGYMMMALGVGGWLAGMMHLMAHAFFKSLLFLGAGCVIHATRTNEMAEMGGLFRKMPVTAYTMLVGCLAIAGAGIPFVLGLLGGPAWVGLGLSGFHSKDAILEHACRFMQHNVSPWAAVFFVAGSAGAAITAFYMFRMWYLTFVGAPRNRQRFDHAHEAPRIMHVPLIVLALLAIAVAWDPVQGLLGSGLASGALFIGRLVRRRAGACRGAPRARFEFADLPLALSLLVFAVACLWWLSPWRPVHLSSLLRQSEPALAKAGAQGVLIGWQWPGADAFHDPGTEQRVVVPATLAGVAASLAGFVVATLMYGLGCWSPEKVRARFPATYRFLRGKWWFDELYDRVFLRPTLAVSRMAAGIDRRWIDGIVDNLARSVCWFSAGWDRMVDRRVVDGFVNGLAARTYWAGRSLRGVQTGRIRQYVMFLVFGAVAIFVLVALWNSAWAG